MTRVTRVYSSWALYTNLQLRGAPCTHQIHRFKMNHIHNELHPPPWWPSPGTLGVLQEADTPWPGPSCLEWPAGCSLWESLPKKKTTSDFPIETLSKIEDFHGFPPPPLITRCILSVHLGLKILNMAHPRPNWFLLLESAFLLVEPKPPPTLRLLNLHFLMDRFMAKLGPRRQKKASQSILTESFKFTVMLPSKYPRTVAL